MRTLGGILAANRQRPEEDIFADYGRELGLLFARPFRYTAMINALQHALGGLSAGLPPEARRFLLDLLEEYRGERIPLSVLFKVLEGWAISQGNGDLLGQRLLSPYPLDLMLIADSGRGRPEGGWAGRPG